MGPSATDVLDACRAHRAAGHQLSAVMRDEVTRLYIEHAILELVRLRTLSQRLAGREPGPEASVRKILADEHGQRVMSLGKALIGAGGLLAEASHAEVPPMFQTFGTAGFTHGYLFARALTIGGGTGEVQRNILAERVLGLPRDPVPTTFSAHGNQTT
jgi:alkylation response protein AidB-like acyl-CoA dehydrogenase